MAKKPQSPTARIRKLLEQGKSVKHIAATVKCTPALVYQVKAYDKKKVEKKPIIVPGSIKGYQQAMQQAAFSTSNTSIIKTGAAARKAREDALNMYQTPTPHSIQYGAPLDYYQPKQSLFQRIKNFFLGA